MYNELLTLDELERRFVSLLDGPAKVRVDYGGSGGSFERTDAISEHDSRFAGSSESRRHR